MESILIHPKNAEQLKIVKAVLKALNVQFERQSNKLPLHVAKSITKSVKQFEGGQTISLQQFKEKHLCKR